MTTTQHNITQHNPEQGTADDKQHNTTQHRRVSDIKPNRPKKKKNVQTGATDYILG